MVGQFGKEETHMAYGRFMLIDLPSVSTVNELPSTKINKFEKKKQQSLKKKNDYEDFSHWSIRAAAH